MKRGKRQSLDYRGEGHPTVSRLTARFSLLGGGTAWFIHLISVYVIGEFGCRAGWGHWIVGGLSVVAWLLLVATVLTGMLAGSAAYASGYSAKVLRRADRATAGEAVVAAESKYFIARISLFLNGIFAFIIFVQGIPIFFFLRTC